MLNKKRLLSLFLAFTMVFTMIPQVFAAGGTDAVTYEIADSFEFGKTYLIVDADDGEAKALTNTKNSSFGTTSVTISGQKIVTEDDLSAAEWEAKAASSSTLIGLYNSTTVLKVDASNTSSPYIKTSGTSYNAGGFGYTANNHISYPYGSNPVDYYIGSDAEDGFTASASETDLGKVYIFAKDADSDEDEPTESVTVTPTTDKPTASATVKTGETFTLKITNDSSRSAYDFTIEASKSGVVSLDKSTVNVAAGATESITVTGLADGEVELNISNGNSSYSRKAAVTVTVGSGDSGSGEDEPTESVAVTPTTDNPTASATVKTGETFTLNITNGSSSSAYDFTIEADKSGIVSLDKSTVNVAAGATETVTVTGLAEGKAVLSITNNNEYGDQYSRKATITVTVGNGGGSSDDPGTKPSEGAVYLAFTSDVHNQSGNASATRLDNWLKNVSAKLGNITFDEFGFCGDMGPASGSDSSFWNYAQTVMDTVADSTYVTGNGFYVCGNHEYNPGSYSHNKNSTTQKYSEAGEYVIEDDYILYSLGARQWNEIYSDDDIKDLSDFLEEYGASGKPIFILSHFPLHCYNNYSSGESTSIHDGKAAQGTQKLITLLNNYPNVFYLWGHNHSSSNDHYDAIYTEKINNYDINFTYCSAGAMSDSEYGSSGNVKGKGLVAIIDNGTVTLQYYSLSYNPVMTSDVERELEGTTPATTYEIAYTAGEHGSVSGSATVKEGKNVTVSITADLGYEIDTVTVNGQPVTVSGNSFVISDVKENKSISVTFKAAAGKSFALATEVKAGSSYILVSNDYALYNNNGVISAIPVIVSGNTVFVNDSDVENATWIFNAASTTDKSGDFEIANDGYLLTRVSDESGSTMAATITKDKNVSSASGLPYYQWSYDVENGNLSHVGGQDQSATFYAFYDESNKAFYTATEADELKLYSVAEAVTVSVSDVTLDKEALTLTEGETSALTAEVAPANATNKGVTYTSDNTAVATVDNNGNVTAVGAGSAVITVTTDDGAKTDTCAVTVNPATVSVSGVTLDKEALTLTEGETSALTAEVAPANATNKNVTFTSDNTDVATVDNNGNVTAVGEGTAIITVTAEGNKTATCTITVKASGSDKDPITECKKDSECPISDFSDTTVDFWWHDGIHYCLENGLMNGVGKNTAGENCFDPNGITSRAMIVTILWRLEGKPSVDYNMTFKDVPTGTWYTEAIRWAASVGVVNGYDADKFGPDDNITREQLAAILYRYATKIKNDDKNISLDKPLNFTDKNLIDSYAVDAVHWCYEAGIVQGKGDGIFDPLGDATRAEAATMIYRFCKLFND